MEMHLESLRAQTVAIPGLELELSIARGERIWTESSHEFTSREIGEIAEMGEAAGLSLRRQWIDDDWPFALTLFVAGANE